MEIYNGSYVVYLHINKINNKIYVGLSKDVKERWRDNGKNYCESPKFFNAIKKYGWDNFEHTIFAANLTKDEAINMEKLLIKKLNTTDDKYGYNITEGGETFAMNDKMKEKLAKSAHERFYGVSFTEDHKKKISNTRMFYSGCVPGKRPIICVETKQRFESLAEASKLLHIPHSSISHVLSGKRSHTHNLHFIYDYA